MARKPIDTIAQVKEMGLSGILHLASEGAIEREEQAGQDYLVSEPEMLPRKVEGARENFEALGFSFGEDLDDLFCRARLPEGWEKRGSDHSMWSYIDDEKGRERVAIFYKAAFYDRKAFMRLTSRFTATCSKYLRGMEQEPLTGLVVDADGAVVWRSAPLSVEELETLPDYECSERLRDMAREWLEENYPDPYDPMKHWD